MRIDLDINKLTLGELKLFERMGGDMTRPKSPATIAAFVLIAMKRENPAATMDDVEALTIAELEFEDDEEVGKLDPKATKTSGKG